MLKIRNSKDIWIGDLVILLLFIIILTVAFVKLNTSQFDRLIKQSNVVSAIILSEAPNNCLVANLRLYWWFRSKNEFPSIEVGKKNGQGHVWLFLNDTIFDATDPSYNGKPYSKLDKIYKVSPYEQFPTE
jgi:hypothetical protein